eukprot:tig00000545_g2010.t1
MALDLLQLQNLCKRDPPAYKEEFELQLRHFDSQLQIFKLAPSKETKGFGELVSFLSQVTLCYPKELAGFPNEIMALLEEHYAVLHPDLRRTLVQALILMRNRNLIPVANVLSLFFKLFRCKDKALRQQLFLHIVNDIKTMNQKHKENKVNKTLQNFMYTMLQDPCQQAAKKSLDVMIELYRKKICV